MKNQEMMLHAPSAPSPSRDIVTSDVNDERPLFPSQGWEVLHAFLTLTHHIPKNGKEWLKFNLLGLSSIRRSSLQTCERTSPQNCCP